jgi:hypothetical protein
VVASAGTAVRIDNPTGRIDVRVELGAEAVRWKTSSQTRELKKNFGPLTRLGTIRPISISMPRGVRSAFVVGDFARCQGIWHSEPILRTCEVFLVEFLLTRLQIHRLAVDEELLQLSASFQRVAVGDDQVGNLAFVDGTQLFRKAKNFRRI